MNPVMKENDLILYLKKILEYPKPSQNLNYHKKNYINDKSFMSCYFRKLLYIKHYNSLLDANCNEFILKADVSKNIRDDCICSYKNFKVEYVPFDTTYFGILSIGNRKTLVNTDKQNIKVGIKTRNTILFESYDRILHIDLNKPIDLKFTRFKPHTNIFREFCIEQSKKSLRDVYPYLLLIANESNIKILSLEFISVKNKLFFGGDNIDCYTLGDSLLFYSKKFRDGNLIKQCGKIKEYVQHVLSEIMVSPNEVPDYLFLFETLSFIERLYFNDKKFNKEDNKGNKEDNKEDNMNININDMDTFFNPIDLDTTYKNLISLPINLNTAYSYIMSDINTNTSNSKCYNKIFGIYTKALDFFNTGLHIYLNKKDIENMINNVLLQGNFYHYEVLGIVSNLTSIKNIFKLSNHNEYESLSKLQIRDTLVQHSFHYDLLIRDLLDLVQNILKNTRDFFIKIKKDRLDLDIKDVIDLIIDLYYNLLYIDNKIITNFFSSGILRQLNSFNLDNIKKISRKKVIIDRLNWSRNNYNLERKLCDIMNIDLNPTYSTLEKKALLRISGIKEITKVDQIPGVLEKGKGLDEDLYKRYKIYIYEYLKEKNYKDYEIYFT